MDRYYGLALLQHEGERENIASMRDTVGSLIKKEAQFLNKLLLTHIHHVQIRIAKL